MKQTAVRDSRSADEVQADSLRRLALDCEPPPPGETGRELSFGDAIAVMHDMLVTVLKPADHTYSVKDLDFKRVAGRLVMHAKLLDGRTVIEFDVRMPRARAMQLWSRLGMALGL